MKKYLILHALKIKPILNKLAKFKKMSMFNDGKDATNVLS